MEEIQKKKGRRPSQMILLVMLILSSIAFVYFLVAYIRENTLQKEPYSTPPPVTVTPSPTPAAEASATPSPTPYVKLAPVHLYFPKQEMDMEIQPVGRDEQGRMDTVDSHLIAAWYEPGPAPGDEGNALLNGHVRWKKQKGYFSVLKDMELYDPIVTLHEDGSVRVFYVVSVDIYALDEVPEEVMSRKGERRVTMITCDGDFDRTLGTSVNRCVVVCKLEEDIPGFDESYRYDIAGLSGEDEQAHAATP